jgi:hypothetical protein
MLVDRDKIYEEYDKMYNPSDTPENGPEEEVEVEEEDLESSIEEKEIDESDTSKKEPDKSKEPSKPVFKYKTQEEAEKAADEAAKKMHEATQETARLKKQIESGLTKEDTSPENIQKKEEPTFALTEEEYADYLVNPEKTFGKFMEKVEETIEKRIQNQRNFENESKEYQVIEENFLRDNPDLVDLQRIVAINLLTVATEGTVEDRLAEAARATREWFTPIRDKILSEHTKKQQDKIKGKLGSSPKGKHKVVEEEEEEETDSPEDYFAERQKLIAKNKGV